MPDLAARSPHPGTTKKVTGRPAAARGRLDGRDPPAPTTRWSRRTWRSPTSVTSRSTAAAVRSRRACCCGWRAAARSAPTTSSSSLGKQRRPRAALATVPTGQPALAVAEPGQRVEPARVALRGFHPDRERGPHHGARTSGS